VHRREPDAGTGKFRLAVQALERPEELLRVRHVESGAVVANEKHGLAAVLVTADLYPSVSDRSGELPAVSQQVFEHDLQQPQLRQGLTYALGFRSNFALQAGAQK
jgi:hypothetical protein